MTYRLLIVCVFLASCNYWRTTPRGDVAPAQWGAPAAYDPAPAGVPGSTASSSTEQRLRNLGVLRRDGIITEAEYRERRKKVLAESFR